MACIHITDFFRVGFRSVHFSFYSYRYCAVVPTLKNLSEGPITSGVRDFDEITSDVVNQDSLRFAYGTVGKIDA